MKGDFTRDTFDPGKHFLRVLMQQGRVQVDADWNEQVAILLHYMQTLAADLIGPHGGPPADCGFEIQGLSKTEQGIDFGIGTGRYYVDGILCENGSEDVTYLKQPDFPAPPPLEDELKYFVYLDVWERHITYFEDEAIREVALGGSDTASRSKVIWQVKAQKLNDDNGNCKKAFNKLTAFPLSTALLKARTEKPEHPATEEPCVLPPEARYRGMENRLYRVEIHTGNLDEKGEVRNLSKKTFKWSRDNGSVILAIEKIIAVATPTKVILADLGSGCEISLAVGNWVEIVDDESVLMNEANPLLKIIAIDQIDRIVTLEGVSEGIDMSKHPLLRRWDFKPIKGPNAPKQADDNALLIEEGKWLTLENGVQIWFEEAADNSPRIYRTGDYWLIPARVETGDIEWPEMPGGQPQALPPRGVLHHYAPLAILSVQNHDTIVQDGNGDCRCKFDPLPCK